MALQGSGQISFLDLQNEFGGSNPIGINEYYRGGSYVPTTITGSYSSYQWNINTYFWRVYGSNTITIEWNNTVVYTTTSGSGSTTDVTTGGYDYNRGTLQYSSGGGKGGEPYLWHQVRRRSASETVNTGIPASGTIDMADFYNGRNS